MSCGIGLVGWVTAPPNLPRAPAGWGCLTYDPLAFASPSLWILAAVVAVAFPGPPPISPSAVRRLARCAVFFCIGIAVGALVAAALSYLVHAWDKCFSPWAIGLPLYLGVMFSFLFMAVATVVKVALKTPGLRRPFDVALFLGVYWLTPLAFLIVGHSLTWMFGVVGGLVVFGVAEIVLLCSVAFLARPANQELDIRVGPPDVAEPGR